MTKQENWEHMQAQYRSLYEQQQEARTALEVKYGRTAWATRSEKAKLEAAGRRVERVYQRMFTWLDQHSPRAWRSAPIPSHWICESLTYADAVTTGPLSVTPPPAYGYGEYHATAFAKQRVAA